MKHAKGRYKASQPVKKHDKVKIYWKKKSFTRTLFQWLIRLKIIRAFKFPRIKICIPVMFRWILYLRTFKVIIAWKNIASYPSAISVIIPNFTTVCKYPLIVISNELFMFFFFYVIFLDVCFLFLFFLRKMVDHHKVNFFQHEVVILVGQVLFS